MIELHTASSIAVYVFISRDDSCGEPVVIFIKNATYMFENTDRIAKQRQKLS